MRPQLSISIDQVDSAVEALRSDYHARQQFMADPSGVLAACNVPTDGTFDMTLDATAQTTEACSVNAACAINAAAAINVVAVWNAGFAVVAEIVAFADAYLWGGNCDWSVYCNGS